MTHEQKEANYTRFSRNPARIDGAVHNQVVTHLGTAFNYHAMEPLAAVEIAFGNDPYGNMRSILVADLNAARALRDQLEEILERAEVEK